MAERLIDVLHYKKQKRTLVTDILQTLRSMYIRIEHGSLKTMRNSIRLQFPRMNKLAKRIENGWQHVCNNPNTDCMLFRKAK